MQVIWAAYYTADTLEYNIEILLYVIQALYLRGGWVLNPINAFYGLDWLVFLFLCAFTKKDFKTLAGKGCCKMG